MDLDSHYQMGSLIPLANAENQRLQQEILERQQRFNEWKRLCQENNNLIGTLRYEQSVHEESLRHAHEFVTHFRAESQEIEHINKLHTLQKNWIKKEVRMLQEKIALVEERTQQTQEKIRKNQSSVAKLDKRLLATKEVQKTWSDVANAQEKENNSILQYSKEDEHKIRELEVTVHRMRREEREVLQELDKLHAENHLLTTEFNRVNQDFEQMKRYREQEIKQWEANMKQMAARDREVENLTNAVNEIQNQLCEQMNEIEWRENSLASESKGQIALSNTIQKREHELANLQEQHTRTIIAAETLQAEVDCTKAFAEKRKAEVTQKRSRLKLKQELLSKKRSLLTESQQAIAMLEVQLKQAQNYTVTASEQKQQVLQRLQDESDRAKRLQTQLEQLSNQKSQQENQLRQLQDGLQTLEIEIQSTEASLHHNTRSYKNLQELMKQVEDNIYDKNMQRMKLELQYRNLLGEPNSKAEKETQDNRIRTLSREMEEKRAILLILRQELLTSQSLVARCEHQKAKQKDLQSSLENRAVQLRLESDALEREMQLQHQQLEELRLAETLIRLQSQNRQKLLRAHANQVWDLEKQKLELQAAIEERKVEIHSRLAVSTVEYRSLKESVQHLNLTAKQHWNKVEKNRLRYQVLADTFGEEQQASPPTEAYLIIKLAQEKESLKEILEDLNSKNTKSEKDNEALSNTLKVISSSNQQFRQHAIVGVPDFEKQSIQEGLESQKRRIDSELRERIKDLQTIEKGIKFVEEESRNFVLLESKCQRDLEEEEQNLFLAQKDVSQIKLRFQKAQQLVRRQCHALHSSSGVRPTLEEMDFDLQLKKEQCQRAMEILHEALAYQFRDCSASIAEVEARFQSYLMTAASSRGFDKSNFEPFGLLTCSVSPSPSHSVFNPEEKEASVGGETANTLRGRHRQDQTAQAWTHSSTLVKPETHLHLPHFHFNPSIASSLPTTPNSGSNMTAISSPHSNQSQPSHRSGHHFKSNSLSSAPRRNPSPRRTLPGPEVLRRRISAPAKIELAEPQEKQNDMRSHTKGKRK